MTDSANLFNSALHMSRHFLEHLNGSNRGAFRQFLDGFKGEPRIAWYPSAGEDFRALMYLDSSYAAINPAILAEPSSPDIFLFTDYFPWKNSNFLDTMSVYLDHRTEVSVGRIEQLPKLNLLPLHKEIVNFPEGSHATDLLLFFQITIESNKLGTITYPVIYAFAENETFYCKKMAPNKAIISHVIHVRYGGGLGGGGRCSGIWLLNVLKQLNCELFITDGHYFWQQGDEYIRDNCPYIPSESDLQLIPIREIPGEKWSAHGDVSWNLVN